MKTKRFPKALLWIAVGLLVSTSVSAFVLLSPARTWDNAPTYIIDDRGSSSITDSDGGVSAVVSAIKSNQAWNGAGAGTVINAQAGSVANYQLGDGIPMLSFRDPINACKGSCLAATFTGFFENRNDGSVRIFDADSDRSSRSKRDPWVNMLRGTAETFAAAIGGADTISVVPFDDAVGESEALARRIARNTQHVLREESYLDRVDDPAAGSFAFEQLTDGIAREAWAELQDIEGAGGMAKALLDGRVARSGEAL